MPPQCRARWRGILFLAFCITSAAHAEEWRKGTVIKVHDGDTATLESAHGRLLRVRFYGVDAPELATEDWPDQAFGREAGAFMRKLLLHQRVSVRLTGERTYGREVGEIFVAERSASQALLEGGFGWWNAKFAPHNSVLAQLEKTARRAKRGLWRDRAAIPPWQFRQRHRSRRQ
jgi:micrococcal nuclease